MIASQNSLCESVLANSRHGLGMSTMKYLGIVAKLVIRICANMTGYKSDSQRQLVGCYQALNENGPTLNNIRFDNRPRLP